MNIHSQWRRSIVITDDPVVLVIQRQDGYERRRCGYGLQHEGPPSSSSSGAYEPGIQRSSACRVFRCASYKEYMRGVRARVTTRLQSRWATSYLLRYQPTLLCPNAGHKRRRSSSEHEEDPTQDGGDHMAENQAGVTKKKKRKGAPKEMSSKKPVSRMRTVVEPSHKPRSRGKGQRDRVQGH
jgi:hypothetical protein